MNLLPWMVCCEDRKLPPLYPFFREPGMAQSRAQAKGDPESEGDKRRVRGQDELTWMRRGCVGHRSMVLHFILGCRPVSL